MTTGTPTYRWNTSSAAEAFDQAAEFIHPFYRRVQDELIGQLQFEPRDSFLMVDLGGGSGRLAEQVLGMFPQATVALVDQSEPFLAIAERRLHRFGKRAALVQRRLQDNWSADLPARPQAIVSMSAIHHLDTAEKRSLFEQCHEMLPAHGEFTNGDEYRPESNEDYLATLQWWGEHMKAAEQRGDIPESFHPVLEAWYDRNIRRFGEPKTSGDDCLETVTIQMDYLRVAGFSQVEAVWADKLWGVVVARK